MLARSLGWFMCICCSAPLLGCATKTIDHGAAYSQQRVALWSALAGFAFQDAPTGLIVSEVYVPDLRLEPGDVITCITTNSYMPCGRYPLTAASLAAVIQATAWGATGSERVINLKIRRGSEELRRSVFLTDRHAVERQKQTAGLFGDKMGNDDGSSVLRVRRVFRLIKENYVELLQDRALADHCINALIAEGESLGVRLEGPADDPLRDVVNALQSVQPKQEEVAAESCIRGMVAATDQGSSYLDKVEFHELAFGSGTAAGIGLELAPDAVGAKIVATIDGAPAEAAGLLPGDLISAVDRVDLRGHSLNSITRLLRGVPGSTVTVTVQRAGSGVFDLRMNRELIRVSTIRSFLLESGVVYIAPSAFQEGTLVRFADTIVQLRSQNQTPFNGVILDLRSCRGGLLNTAVGLAAVFLPAGVLVVDTRGNGVSKAYRADPKDYIRGRGDDPLTGLPTELKTVPVVVLVGPRTASGAEIVASALQDHKRATMVGERTLGNGTITTIFPLPGETALKLTTARVYRPNGAPLDGKGIVPEVSIEPSFAPVDGTSLPASSVTRTRRPVDVSDPAVVKGLALLRSMGIR